MQNLSLKKKNDIQAILNIPSPDAPKEQAQETKITEQVQEPVQQEYSNPYEQAQQPVQQETVVEQSQNVQEVSEQPSNNIPKKPQSYQRVVEANFSIDNATKQKNKKTDKQNSSLSKIGNFFKSTAGIATIIGVAFCCYCWSSYIFYA